MAYTNEEVAVLETAAEENGSITFEMAKELARQLYKTPRSVIAKVKQLDLPYTPKPAPAKREKGMTKAELVARIAENIGANAEDLDGLGKATARALGRLVELT
jgi:protein-L-isoaspartate O-methyltransferase